MVLPGKMRRVKKEKSVVQELKYEQKLAVSNSFSAAT